MRTLRATFRGTHVTVYILLPLAFATTLTLMGSRSTYAESPTLLGTVRCLVRTILTVECPSTATPAQTPASSPQPSAPSSSTQAPAESNAPATPQKAVPVTGEQMALPEETLGEYKDIAQVPAVNSVSPRLQESEYVAYFNRYSPYAVAGAHDQQSKPVERTAEGWRFLGVAWYWWAAAIILIITIFISVKRLNLRKSSVLPEST